MKTLLCRTWNVLPLLLNAVIIGAAIGILLAEALWRWR